MASTSPTQIDIQTPLLSSASWVVGSEPFPRPPWPFRQRKISTLPEQTAPKVGGLPHWKPFVQPSFSNQATLSRKFETFRIGVTALAIIGVLRTVHEPCLGRYLIA